MPVRSISRCINMCHVSHSMSAGTAAQMGFENAAFHVVSFSRLVHPSLGCHLVPPQPVNVCRWSLNAADLRARAFPEVYAAVGAHSLRLGGVLHSPKKKQKKNNPKHPTSSQHTWSCTTKLQAWRRTGKPPVCGEAGGRTDREKPTWHHCSRKKKEQLSWGKTCAKYSSKSNKWACLRRHLPLHLKGRTAP